MSKDYVVSVKGQTINFKPDEISDIASLNYMRVWTVFTDSCKRYYSEKNSSKTKELNFRPNKLKEHGIELIRNALSAENVRALKQEWEEHFIPIKISRDSEKIDYLEDGKEEYSVVNYRATERSAGILSQSIMKAINPVITQKIEHYLGSHFAISHILLAEAFPDKDPITSFRWHCDGGPACQTHIMIYLDDAEETGGRTEFLNYEDSRKIRDSGYTPRVASNRLLDITEFDPDVKIIKPSPRAGDMIIFNATRVYHCGIHPTKKSRKVLFVILHSDFLPWTETVAQSEVFNFNSGRNLHSHNPFWSYLKEA